MIQVGQSVPSPAPPAGPLRADLQPDPEYRNVMPGYITRSDDAAWCTFSISSSNDRLRQAYIPASSMPRRHRHPETKTP